MKNLLSGLAYSLTGIFLGVSAVSADNLLINGCFEEPTIPYNTWDVFETDEVPGWTVEWMQDGSPGHLEIQRGALPAGSNACGVGDGDQFAELDSHWIAENEDWCPLTDQGVPNCNIRIWQEFPTCTGVKYTVDYYWRARPGCVLGDAKAEVLWDSLKLATLDKAGISDPDSWEYGIHEVLAGGPTSRLSFQEIGEVTTFGTFLDHTSVTVAGADECTNMDIKFCSNPNAFNQNRTTGLVPVTLFGSDSMNVAEIDPDSLQLCKADLTECIYADKVNGPTDVGSPPDVGIWDCAMATPDGIGDLELKFSADAVCQLIECGDLPEGDSEPLVVYGYFSDGITSFVTNGEVLRINKPDSK